MLLGGGIEGDNVRTKGRIFIHLCVHTSISLYVHPSPLLQGSSPPRPPPLEPQGSAPITQALRLPCQVLVPCSRPQPPCSRLPCLPLESPCSLQTDGNSPPLFYRTLSPWFALPYMKLSIKKKAFQNIYSRVESIADHYWPRPIIYFLAYLE